MNKTEYFCDIMNAYLQGKTIQYQDENGEWVDYNGEDWNFCQNYRIKKDIKPFENAHECFKEMQKHPPIGWLRQKHPRNYVHIDSMEECFDLVEFTDGTPVGKNNTM